MMRRALLVVLALHIVSAQVQTNRYVVTQERSAIPPRQRQTLRPRLSSPGRAQQHANASIMDEETSEAEKASKLFERLLKSSPPVSEIAPHVIPKHVSESTLVSQHEALPEKSDATPTQDAPPPVSTDAPTTLPDRSYRKQYSTGRRRQQNNEAVNLKEILKQSGTLSLSEILQQKNLSLSDFLQGKKVALSVLTEKQSNDNKPHTITEKTIFETTTYKPVYNEVAERIYTTTRRTPLIFKTNQRTSYLSGKRTSPAPTVFQTETRRWPSNSEPDYEQGKADSREDILDLLQPGSPVSLAQLLSSRNMTLAELMDHRERGSKQQPLVDLFSDVLHNTNKSTPARNAVLVEFEPSKSKSSQHVISSVPSTTKPRGSRDPRLLDLIRRPMIAEPVAHDEDIEEDDVQTVIEPAQYEYVDEDDEEEKGSLPVGVQSAILASGGLLGVALILFAAIFLCCRSQQRRRRGTRMPFLRGAPHSKSERSVVIKPAQSKHLTVSQMDDF